MQENRSLFTRRDVLAMTSAAAASAMVGSANADPLAGLAPSDASQPTSPLPAPRPALGQAKLAVERHRPTIVRISREVWERPAVGLFEVDAMNVHLRELEAAGFRVTHRRAGGHPTAFVAEWKQGNGGPVIGFLPEYDALPGLGNAPKAEPIPATNGLTDGHGCGHNCLGAGCTGGAMALKTMMESARTPGTVRVYGCGAEETQGAKVYMVRAGLFDDVDAVLSWHSAPLAGTGNIRMTANRKMKVYFRGKTAHAGDSPWDGRSALDALELFAHSLNLMREHVQPTARIHYVYEQAGIAPNVVPDEAQMWLVIRERSTELILAMQQWVEEMARGAALCTQTESTVNVFAGVAELIPNDPLARRLYEHVVNVPLNWTDEEVTFARECQRAMGLPEAGLASRAMPFLNDLSSGGSTDVGDVSWKVPVGQFAWPSLPLGVSLHTWAVTACGGMSIGDKASVNAATILAACGFELMTEPELRAAALADHKKRLGEQKYICAIPETQKEPIGAPKYLTKTGQDDFIVGLAP